MIVCLDMSPILNHGFSYLWVRITPVNTKAYATSSFTQIAVTREKTLFVQTYLYYKIMIFYIHSFDHTFVDSYNCDEGYNKNYKKIKIKIRV